MTGDEVGKLLGLMALADNRKPPEDDEGRRAIIAFWLSMIGDLSFADAAQAVQLHYQETRDWIMPADIRRRVKAMRSERIAHSVIPAPPPEVTDNTNAYREALTAETGQAADGHGRPTSRHLALVGPESLPKRPDGPPVSLRAALAEFRAKQSGGQAQPLSPQETALQQAEAARARRKEREASGDGGAA